MYNILFIIILISFQKIIAKEYVSSSIKGNYLELIVSNDEYLITCLDSRNISIFKEDKLLIKFDKIFFEQYFNTILDKEIYEFEYDYINNRIYFQKGNKLLYYDLENDNRGSIVINDYIFYSFFPNGNSVYLLGDNELVEYDVSKEIIKNNYSVDRNEIEYFSINSDEVSIKYDDKFYLISENKKIKIFENDNLNITFSKVIKTTEGDYFIIYQTDDDFYKINLYDVDKNKVVERIELSQFGLIDVSFKDNAIFYSNVNLKLEYLNLITFNKVTTDINCNVTFGNNNIHTLYGRKFYYLNSFEPNQLTLDYGTSFFRKIDFVYNNEYLLLYDDAQSHFNLYILNLSGEVLSKISISGRNYVSTDDALYFQSEGKDIYKYVYKNGDIEKIIEYDNEITETARTLSIYDNVLYIGKRKRIDYFNLVTKEQKSFNLNHFVSSFIDVADGYLYAFLVTEENNDQVNIAKISLSDFQIEWNDANYSKYLSGIERYFVKDELLYFISDNKWIHKIDYKNLSVVDSVLTSFNKFEMKLINDEIYLSSDSIIYSLKGYETHELYEYKKNYNFTNAQYFSGLVSFAFKDNNIFLIDEENIIWKDKILISSVKSDLDSKLTIDYLNDNTINKIEVFDLTGKKLNEFNSVNNYMNFKDHSKKLNIILIHSLEKIYPLKIIR